MTELPPGIFYIEVCHDDDCPLLRTRRLDDCNCEPTLTLHRDDARFTRSFRKPPAASEAERATENAQKGRR